MKKAALIGFGYWGPNIARNLKNSTQFELAAICDADEAKLKKARGIYGEDVLYYDDYRKIIEDPSIEMCAVALRNEVAQIVARDVLKSKKNLFMEKPMATKMEDALLLKKLAEENKVLIHVDHILVYHPIIREIKSIIESGELGDMMFFECARANLGPHIKNDMNAMWDLAVHDLAVLDYLCGAKTPTNINCMGIKRFSSQESLTYLTIQYPYFVASLKSSWISPIKERRIVIGGTKKMIVFDDVKESEKLMIYDKGVEFNEELFAEYGKYEARIRMGDLYVPNVLFEDSLLNGLNHFAACIENGQQSNSGPDQAIHVLNILEKADKSLKSSI